MTATIRSGSIAIPNLVRPEIEAALDVLLLDSPIAELHVFRENTTDVDREGLRARIATLDDARARHADLVAQLDAGFLPADEAAQFAHAALDDARATLVDVVEVSNGTIDVDKIERGARVIAALEGVYTYARYEVAETSDEDPAADGPATPVIDPVAIEELRRAANRLLRLAARDVTERMERSDDIGPADEDAIDALYEAIERRDLIQSGTPLLPADLAVLKEEVLGYAAAIEGESVDWSEPHKVAERARQLVAVADLGTRR